MDHKYRIEIDEFRKHFSGFENKKIILYGIGRYTATLVQGLHDFQIVGLMDKDPENVGKKLFGLPIMDKQTAETAADMIVINTSETYWNVIYNRIAEMKIPVFYKNGVMAKKKKRYISVSPYGNMDRKKLDKLLEDAEVISFDFYDTLFMRAVCSPGDVFRLLEQEIRSIWRAEKGFIEIRNDVIKELPSVYSFDQLYMHLEKVSGLSHTIIQKIKEKEIALEKKLLSPRTELIDVLKQTIKREKEVYLISDMYLPKEFYTDVFKQYGISIPESSILLSNVLRKSKSDGSLWEYYAREIVKGRLALHLGDHRVADVEIPQTYGIHALLMPSAWELMSASSMGGLSSQICADYDSMIVGCILKQLFRDPYMMQDNTGIVRIKNNWEMGYVVFGPVMLTFLCWLRKRKEEDKVGSLIFMSRDGYFLKEDYEYLCCLKDEEPICNYIGISRQLAMSAAITTEEELLEYALMPYTGGITELFEDRFGIKDVKVVPDQTIESYIQDYHLEIWQRLSSIRNNYLHYLDNMQLREDSAVVDLGYYGNNQRYLNKLINKKLRGYYFNVNLSKQNENVRYQTMKACFQREDDPTGEKSQVLKRMIFLESVLTAPYGMVKGVDKNYNLVYAKKGNNQKCFQDKVEINQGIKDFMKDYIEIFGDYDISLNREFVDWYYGFCMSGALEIDSSVKQSFYNDNAMMNRIESMLFY